MYQPVLVGTAQPQRRSSGRLPWLHLFCAVVIIAALGCRRQSGPAPDIIAVVGTHEITAAEFQQWMQRRAVGNSSAQREALLQEMIEFYSQFQRACDLNLDKDPELRQQWASMVVSRLRESQLEPQLTNALPTAQQIQQYYEQHQDSFLQPALCRAAILRLDLNPKTTPARKAELHERLVQARAQALTATNEVPGFGALAVACSDDQATRYKGGELGWLQQARHDGRLEPAIHDAFFALNHAGEISDIIETTNGLYLLKVLELRPRQLKPLETVRAMIQHRLLIEGESAIEMKWKQSVRASIKTTLYAERVANLPQLPSNTTEPASGPGALP